MPINEKMLYGRRCFNVNKSDENYIYYLVGQNLKKQRQLKCLSITKFSMLCNYSEGFIKNIESPKYKQTFSLGTLWTFANALNIDIRELFAPLEKD